MSNIEIINKISFIKDEMLYIFSTKNESSYQEDIETVENMRLKVNELLISSEQDKYLDLINSAFLNASASLIQNMKNDLIFQSDTKGFSAEAIKEYDIIREKTAEELIKFHSYFTEQI